MTYASSCFRPIISLFEIFAPRVKLSMGHPVVGCNAMIWRRVLCNIDGHPRMRQYKRTGLLGHKRRMGYTGHGTSVRERNRSGGDRPQQSLWRPRRPHRSANSGQDPCIVRGHCCRCYLDVGFDTTAVALLVLLTLRPRLKVHASGASTTVVTRRMLLQHPSVPHDADNGNMWRRFGATGAAATRRGYRRAVCGTAELTASNLRHSGTLSRG